MAQSAETLAETHLFIGGEWQPSASGRQYEVRNPAFPDEVVGQAAQADKEDVERAVRAAHDAFPAWSALSFSERAEYLRKIAEHVVADKEDLDSRIHLFTREHGKILRESTLEMTRLGDRFLYCDVRSDLHGDQTNICSQVAVSGITEGIHRHHGSIRGWKWTGLPSNHGSAQQQGPARYRP